MIQYILPPDFNVEQYLANYPDLKAAYNNKPLLEKQTYLAQHYMTIGIKEFRSYDSTMGPPLAVTPFDLLNTLKTAKIVNGSLVITVPVGIKYLMPNAYGETYTVPDVLTERVVVSLKGLNTGNKHSNNSSENSSNHVSGHGSHYGSNHSESTNNDCELNNDNCKNIFSENSFNKQIDLTNNSSLNYLSTISNNSTINVKHDDTSISKRGTISMIYFDDIRFNKIKFNPCVSVYTDMRYFNGDNEIWYPIKLLEHGNNSSHSNSNDCNKNVSTCFKHSDVLKAIRSGTQIPLYSSICRNSDDLLDASVDINIEANTAVFSAKQPNKHSENLKNLEINNKVWVCIIEHSGCGHDLPNQPHFIYNEEIITELNKYTIPFSSELRFLRHGREESVRCGDNIECFWNKHTKKRIIRLKQVRLDLTAFNSINSCHEDGVLFHALYNIDFEIDVNACVKRIDKLTRFKTRDGESECSEILIQTDEAPLQYTPKVILKCETIDCGKTLWASTDIKYKEPSNESESESCETFKALCVFDEICVFNLFIEYDIDQCINIFYWFNGCHLQLIRNMSITPDHFIKSSQQIKLLSNCNPSPVFSVMIPDATCHNYNRIFSVNVKYEVNADSPILCSRVNNIRLNTVLSIL